MISRRAFLLGSTAALVAATVLPAAPAVKTLFLDRDVMLTEENLYFMASTINHETASWARVSEEEIISRLCGFFNCAGRYIPGPDEFDVAKAC